MILPKSSGKKNELYVQVQNQLRIQNRHLISQLLGPDQLIQSEKEEKLTNNVDMEAKGKIFATKCQTEDVLLKKSTKLKKFENVATNTENSSCSDDGYRNQFDKF